MKYLILYNKAVSLVFFILQTRRLMQRERDEEALTKVTQLVTGWVKIWTQAT